MQDISTGTHPPKSNIKMLPIININPSDPTCIYSTLLFVIDQSKKLNVETPSITFDQPLWYKATDIVIEKSLKIVVHLGGFHTLMSFVGSIGCFMDGSGLECALQTIYGENSVKHMMYGKAIARAIRGHIFVDSALNLNIQKLAIDKLSSTEINEIEDHCEKVFNKEINASEVSCNALEKFNNVIDTLKSEMASKLRTAKLWFQYMDYINYAKSARLYLQLMLDLPHTHPWMYQKLSTEGFSVIRRSERYWAGLWPDLVIEQVKTFLLFSNFMTNKKTFKQIEYFCS